MSSMSTPEEYCEAEVVALKLGDFEDDEEGDDIQDFCPCDDHSSKRKNLSVKDFIMRTNGILRAFPEVESICLTSKVTPPWLLTRILEHCPNLFCLHINLTKFTSQSLALLKSEIAPKLIHLSTNGSITFISPQHSRDDQEPVNELIEMCTKLEDWDLTIKANDKFDPKCFESLSETITYLCLKDQEQFSWDEQQSYSQSYEQHSIENYMKHLSRGKGSGLEFLRIENDEDYKAQRAFKYIARLSKLRGLNISVRNEVFELDGYILKHYKNIAKMEFLESFTMKIQPDGGDEYTDCSDNTNEILKVMSRAKFRHNLKRFRLKGAELELMAFRRAMKAFKNIESLQFIDCLLFKDESEAIVQNIIDLKNLREVIVEINEPVEFNSDFRHFTSRDLETIETRCRNRPHSQSVQVYFKSDFEDLEE